MVKKIVYSFLIVLACIGAYMLGFYLFKPDPVVLDDVSLRDIETKEENKGMAIMLGDGEGNYNPSSESGFPDNSMYTFNSEKSGCIDLNGNPVDGVLSYDDASSKASINTGMTVSCYLYFDLNNSEIFGEYLKNNVFSNATAYSGLYRYTGETANNYVDMGGVLYRVIGVTDDSTTNTDLGLIANQVKLIKAESIGTKQWYTDYTTDVRWNVSGYTVSPLYTNLQGSYALNNTSVIPSAWTSKISSVKWYVGDVNINTYGSNILQNASTVFSYEDDLTTQSTSKVGLIYMSDYYYSVNDGGTTNCSNSTCLSWMKLGSAEWTMSRYGYDGSYYRAWGVWSAGSVFYDILKYAGAVRPVIYLSPDVIYTGKGDGSEGSPYELAIPPVVETTINNNKTENATLTITSNESGTYCVNTSSDVENMENCVFSGNITAGTPITTSKFTTEGTYYVHVKGNKYTGISSAQVIALSNPIPLGEYLLENDLSGKTAYSGLYRYTGTTANNYVDLGGVLYRVIGVTDNSTINTDLGLSANQVKLIKAESIGNNIWNTNYYNTDARWNVSGYTVADLYTTLQSNTVLGSSTVIPSAWTSKISSVKWYVGDVNNDTPTNAGTVFGYEDNSTTQSTSKVGLMYLSDYYYAYNDGGTQNCNSSPYCVSWMTDETHSHEWTMTRYGVITNGIYGAWAVQNDGDVSLWPFNNTYAVRPVIYLSPDVIYTGTGDGSSGSPYELAIPPVVETTINNNKTENATLTITSNESGTYCVNTSSDVENMENCVFSGNITAGTPITTSVFTTEGTYYAHVKGSKYTGISSAQDISFNPTFGEYLLQNALSGKTAYSGLYRYTGTSANNYVSVGGVLYRVIGVTDGSTTNTDLGLTANQVKVIKAATIGDYAWYTDYTTDVRWNVSGYTVSPLYTNLQGSYALSNTSVIPSAWTSKISSVKWYVGDINGISTTYIKNGSTVFGYEDNAKTQSISKVGLMYLSDYYYAYNDGGTTNCKSSACSSWMTLGSDEWTMSRYGKVSSSVYNAWVVGSDGSVDYWSLYRSYAVRPVFYLDSSVLYTGEGNGSSGSPYQIQ